MGNSNSTGSLSSSSSNSGNLQFQPATPQKSSQRQSRFNLNAHQILEDERDKEKQESNIEKQQEAVFGLEEHIYIPLLMIYKMERVSQVFGDQKVLEICCKDFRTIYFSFKHSVKSDINGFLDHLKVYFPTCEIEMFAYCFADAFTKMQETLNNKILVDGWKIYNAERELKRILNQDENWRISKANESFELCDTYPQLIAVPARISDDTLFIVKDFRSRGRLPVLSWRHPRTAATITRCSQPKVGLRNTRCKEDEIFLREIMLANQITPNSPAPSSTSMRDSGNQSFFPSSVSLSTAQVQEKQNSLSNSNGASNETNSLSASTHNVASISPNNSSNSSSNSMNIQSSGSSSNKILPLYLMDARPKANAIANQAVGAGFEDTSRYKHTKLRFLQIANIHVMRESVRKLHELTLPNYNKNYDSTFLTNLDSTRWLEYICLIIQSSLRISKLLHAGVNVTIHCSDGWDRTSQVSLFFSPPFLFSLSSFLFPLFSFLFSLSSFPFPLFPFLFSLSSFLFPLFPFLFSLSSFPFPLFSFLFSLSSFLFLFPHPSPIYLLSQFAFFSLLSLRSTIYLFSTFPHSPSSFSLSPFSALHFLSIPSSSPIASFHFYYPACPSFPPFPSLASLFPSPFHAFSLFPSLYPSFPLISSNSLLHFPVNHLPTLDYFPFSNIFPITMTNQISCIT